MQLSSPVRWRKGEPSSCRHVAAQRSNIRSDSFPPIFENILLRKPVIFDSYDQGNVSGNRANIINNRVVLF